MVEYWRKMQPYPFVIACYEQNDIHELVDLLVGEADHDDCEAWHITQYEWKEQILIAVHALIEDRDIQIKELYEEMNK
jgi:hypothetical protein